MMLWRFQFPIPYPLRFLFSSQFSFRFVNEGTLLKARILSISSAFLPTFFYFNLLSIPSIFLTVSDCCATLLSLTPKGICSLITHIENILLLLLILLILLWYFGFISFLLVLGFFLTRPFC